jgi:hypothetical protein
VSLTTTLAGIAPQQSATLFEQANAWIIAEAGWLYMLTWTVQSKAVRARAIRAGPTRRRLEQLRDRGRTRS